MCFDLNQLIITYFCNKRKSGNKIFQLTFKSMRSFLFSDSGTKNLGEGIFYSF